MNRNTNILHLRKTSVQSQPAHATAGMYGLSAPLPRLVASPCADEAAIIARAVSLTFHDCKAPVRGEPNAAYDMLTIEQARDVLDWVERGNGQEAPTLAQRVRAALAVWGRGHA